MKISKQKIIYVVLRRSSIIVGKQGINDIGVGGNFEALHSKFGGVFEKNSLNQIYDLIRQHLTD